MNEVLIVGNGISRISYEGLIRTWPGEVWACNRAYLEFGDILTRLGGHTNVMFEAVDYRQEHNCKFQIWGGHLTGGPFDARFDCPKEFQRDSGTTFVAQALHEKRKVACVGFDLGGPDIHSPDHECWNKEAWVRRWRELFARYGAHRVRFIGFNHKPYIMSDRSTHYYAKQYRRKYPHIRTDKYIRIWEEFTGLTDPGVLPEVEDVPMQRVKVQFVHNKYVTETKPEIAAAWLKKGLVVRVDEPAPVVEPVTEVAPVVTEVTERKRGRPRKVDA